MQNARRYINLMALSDAFSTISFKRGLLNKAVIKWCQNSNCNKLFLEKYFHDENGASLIEYLIIHATSYRVSELKL